MTRALFLISTAVLLAACGSAEEADTATGDGADMAVESSTDGGMDQGTMDHGDMDHGDMEHGDMDQGDMSASGGMGSDVPQVIMGRAGATVMSVSEEGDFITLDHDRIDAINMGAMRMGFEVDAGVSLEGLAEGDRILFEVMATESDIVLTKLCRPEMDGADCLD